jgi:hypothetical protein
VYADELSKVGIHANLIPESGVSFGALYFSGQFQASNYAGLAVAPDPAAQLVNGTLLGGTSLVVGTPYEGRIRALALPADKPGLTLEQRAKLYWKLWKYLDDHALIVSICAQGYMFPHKSDVLISAPGATKSIPQDSLAGSLDPRYFAKLK